ncbi:hypothetical protein VIBNISO65_1660022 [Vibrio nigripulchritudo SO65]|nr:hypothetical protein VIBNIAM115_530001 [Vibrio nigripulchritudo AM115]CCN63693.1 hypothetical protein VIBNIPon4_150023 [Vibrio nigripulchritudo POn4]CCN76797.1 hypothetical protein VIBNISO65_1660022 [Vibrio nigripulchritudo SO65]
MSAFIVLVFLFQSRILSHSNTVTKSRTQLRNVVDGYQFSNSKEVY